MTGNSCLPPTECGKNSQCLQSALKLYVLNLVNANNEKSYFPLNAKKFILDFKKSLADREARFYSWSYIRVGGAESDPYVI